MAADIKTKYPATGTSALTLTLASLASDSSLLAGRASTAVDNYTTTNDLDHLLSGTIRAGTSPTVSTTIEVWVYTAMSISSGSPGRYSDSITGTDANKSITSINVKYAALALAAVITVDATTGRDYDIKPVSIASLFGAMPPFWGIFVVHNTGVALNATQVALQYERIQGQTT